MGLQINEQKFRSWLSVLMGVYFNIVVGDREKLDTAARSCIKIFGEKKWYSFPSSKQVDCLDCYMAGWVDSRRSIREEFK